MKKINPPTIAGLSGWVKPNDPKQTISDELDIFDIVLLIIFIFAVIGIIWFR